MDPNQTDEDMNTNSAGAELAVAKYFNVYPEISPIRSNEGDCPFFDLVMGDKKLEVKSTKRLDGNLLVKKWKPMLTYILVCGTMPSYKIVGSLESDLIKLRGRWTQMPYSVCWRTSRNDLEPIQYLQDMPF